MIQNKLIAFCACVTLLCGCHDKNIVPSVTPNEVVANNLKTAKVLLDAGDYEKAIDYLAKAVAVEEATNRDEAKKLLKDTIGARNHDAMLQQIVKLSPNPNTESPKYVLPDGKWNAEQLVRAYLQSPTWYHRLPLVVNTEKVEPMMQEYYRAGYQPQSIR